MDDEKVELDVGDVIEEIVYDDMNIKCVKLIYILKVQHDWNALFCIIFGLSKLYYVHVCMY